jgi:hypothetical protein
MAHPNMSPSMLAEHELELAAREAELNRREAAVRRAEETRAEADEAQRVRLDEVVAEYESRRELLKQRTIEVEAERDRLRDQEARLVAANLPRVEMTEDTPPPKKIEAGADWWSKQLGAPLEAA